MKVRTRGPAGWRRDALLLGTAKSRRVREQRPQYERRRDIISTRQVTTQALSLRVKAHTGLGNVQTAFRHCCRQIAD